MGATLVIRRPAQAGLSWLVVRESRPSPLAAALVAVGAWRATQAKGNWFKECPRRKGKCLPKGSADESGGGAENNPKAHLETLAKSAVSKEAVFAGEPKPLRRLLNKPMTGKVAERMIGKAFGVKPLNLKQPNYPIDGIVNGYAVEIKGGLIAVKKGSQQWRLTQGQPGKAKAAALAKLTPAQRTKALAEEQAAITARKKAAIRELRKEHGIKLKPLTITAILDTDRNVADVHVFKGYHDRIGWRSKKAKAGFLGSVKIPKEAYS